MRPCVTLLARFDQKASSSVLKSSWWCTFTQGTLNLWFLFFLSFELIVVPSHVLDTDGGSRLHTWPRPLKTTSSAVTVYGLFMSMDEMKNCHGYWLKWNMTLYLVCSGPDSDCGMQQWISKKALQAQNVVKVGVRGLGMHYSDECLPRDRRTVCREVGGSIL